MPPHQLKDEVLRLQIGTFGTVKTSRRCRLQSRPAVFNGVRVCGMQLSEAVPSYLPFGKLLIKLKHAGQVPTCRKCNHPVHQANNCSNTFSLILRGLGTWRIYVIK